jgi:probable rRNA maturation factor
VGEVYTTDVDYLVELQHEVDISGLDSHLLERVAAHALAVEHVARPAELSVVITHDSAIQTLNRDYRATDAATDVLSFSQAEGEAFAVPDGETPHLGDVIISLDTARRQAADVGLALQDEMAHLLVHGILHLLGYDHESPDDEVAMRAHEDAILGAQAHHH